MIIAIDGPAASGKGTIGRKLAQRYGLHYLDTGSLYRAVAKATLERYGTLDEQSATATARGLSIEQLDLRSDALRNFSSEAAVVAAFPEVRRQLLAVQREFAAKPPGAVLDGRDIGTVICPKADAKIFVTADPEMRARRRFRELAGKGVVVTEMEVLSDIRERDKKDKTRIIAPLKPAADAHLLDTTHLDIDAAIRAAIDIVEATRTGRGRS